MNCLVLGLGNEILKDDGVGIHVVRALQDLVHDGETDFAESQQGGLELLDLLLGYERAVIIDALVGGEPGRIRRFSLEELEDQAPMVLTPHRAGLGEAAALARRLGLRFPQEITVYAIEVADPYTVAEGLTEEVARAVPAAVALIAAELRRMSPVDKGPSPR
jgi:hydrogenase maturation protease